MARKVQLSFSGGELSPMMYGRIDDNKYQAGLAKCENFICLPEGAARNRPGFALVRATKYDKPTRLIPFKYSSKDTVVIELGDQYMRFHSDGGTFLTDSGSVYEITTPYSSDDIFEIHYTQSCDVLTLVHKSYPVKELKRYGATDWRLENASFSAPISAPTISSVTYNANGNESENRFTCKYKVTAVQYADEGTLESAGSAAASVSCNLYDSQSTNVINWSSVSGADAYRVYKTYSGLYGYIGETEDLTFEDQNIAPDEGITPPRYDDIDWASSSTTDAPGAVCYFEQRRFFAGTGTRPQMVWATRTGTESNMSYCIPSQSDDRIKFKVASQQGARIQHLVAATQLMALTDSAEIRITSDDGGSITPESTSVKPQSYVGASSVQPVVVNNVALYIASRGSHLRELGYDYNAGGYVSNDMSIRAAHLFENETATDLALMMAPYPIVWITTNAGSLYGCTYMPEQSVGAWHVHTSPNASFESVTCVTEGQEDRLYVVVRRYINGTYTRYIEQMGTFHHDDQSDAFFVDCGVTYEGMATEISGLSHLEGQTVNILADGAVCPQQTVKDGAITLPHAFSKIQIGIPIEAKLQTLPISLQLQDGSYGRGHAMNINKVWLQVYDSSNLWVGPSFDKLIEAKQRRNEPYGLPPDYKTGEVPVLTTPSWMDQGQFCVEQTNPLPLTLVGFCVELAD